MQESGNEYENPEGFLCFYWICTKGIGFKSPECVKRKKQKKKLPFRTEFCAGPPRLRVDLSGVCTPQRRLWKAVENSQIKLKIAEIFERIKFIFNIFPFYRKIWRKSPQEPHKSKRWCWSASGFCSIGRQRLFGICTPHFILAEENML